MNKFPIKQLLLSFRNRILKYKYWTGSLVILGIIYLLLLSGKLFQVYYSTVITDKNGHLLGAKVAADGQWRFPQAKHIDEKLKKATIVFEDQFYYYHPGFNPVSLARALFTNIKSGHIVSGGSTLTMQTIRLYRNKKARTIKEKIIEIILATRLELRFSKDEILCLYTSHAPYGGNVVGAEAASWRYFSHQADELSWAEAALLAVLPNSPSLVNPGKNREILLEKRNRLLKKLLDKRIIDQTTYNTSLTEKIPLKPLLMPALAPHLLNRVYLTFPGQILETTIDADLQTIVTNLVEKHQNELKLNEIHNTAALVIEIETGNILAYVGNTGYPGVKNHSNDVDLITSARSTGSILKPILYAGMINDGKLLPESLIPDIPINLKGFAPRNFDGGFEGAVKASRALSRSLNVPAVEMLKKYGVERFHYLLKQCGLTTLNRPANHYGLSLILGGAEGNLEEMTNIYACFSRVLKHYGQSAQYYSNDFRKATFLNQITREKQQIKEQPEVFNACSIWFAYQAMIAVNRPEEEYGWQNFSTARKIAWKTGTSYGYRDGWAIGTSSRYVVGVWAGNADGEGRPGLTGIATAAPLMFDIFNVLPDADWFQIPNDELAYSRVCRESGYMAGPYCRHADSVKIPFTGLHSPICTFHKMVHLSSDLRYQVNSDCYATDKMVHMAWFVLPPVMEWYYKKRHADYKVLPSFIPGYGQKDQHFMDLLYPAAGNLSIYIPRELDGSKGRAVFEAVHRNPEATIYWHLDNQFIASTRFIHQVELLPTPGEHVLIIVDDTGEEIVRVFKVLEP